MHSLLLHQQNPNIKRLLDIQPELIQQNVLDSQFVIMLHSTIQIHITNGINLPNTGTNQPPNNGINPLNTGINLLNNGTNLPLHNGTNGTMLHKLLHQLATICPVPVVISKEYFNFFVFTNKLYQDRVANTIISEIFIFILHLKPENFICKH